LDLFNARSDDCAERAVPFQRFTTMNARLDLLECIPLQTLLTDVSDSLIVAGVQSVAEQLRWEAYIALAAQHDLTDPDVNRHTKGVHSIAFIL
jgi:hypothetical protein